MKLIFRLAGLLCLMVGILIAGLLLLPGERLARIASEQLSAQLDRDVTIEGDVSLAFWPTVSVSVGHVTIANAEGFPQTPMFEADSAQLGLDAAKLLRGEFQVKRLISESPSILLQERADGSVNWSFETAATTTTSGGTSGQSNGTAPSGDTADSGLPAVTIDRLQITNAAIRYEKENATAVAFSALDLDLTWPDMSGPADVKLGMSPAGTAVSVTAKLASPLGMLDGGAHPVSGTVVTTGGSVTFDGKLSLTPELAGTVSLDLADTARFLQAFGISGVELPEGAGQSASGSTQVTYTADGRLALRSMDMTLDHHRITGDADITTDGARPLVNAKLAAGPLILGQSSTGSSGGSGSTSSGASSGGGTSQASGTSGWSKSPIDASALGTIDAEILVTAPSIKVGDLSFGSSRFLLTIDRARAVFGIRELAAYSGAVTGEFVMNNRNGLSVGGKLNAKQLDTQTLLTDAGVTDRWQGRADAELSFLGVGQSMDAIMRSLSGKGAFSMGNGVITGLDLDQLFRVGGSSGGTTVFDTLGATFDIDSGVLRNDDLLLTIPDGQATGDGKVNLGAQTINYTFTPKSLKARGGEGLAIPVTIKGPWSDPEIDADLAAALELNLRKEKEALEEKIEEEKKVIEQRVRKEVSETLERELDVEVKDDDSIEDVLRRKIEDEAKKGLLNLLGGN